jgi:hypothetical protein
MARVCQLDQGADCPLRHLGMGKACPSSPIQADLVSSEQLYAPCWRTRISQLGQDAVAADNHVWPRLPAPRRCQASSSVAPWALAFETPRYSFLHSLKIHLSSSSPLSTSALNRVQQTGRVKAARL